jgi:nicotinamide mononucleotide (NMN) deamidase PncC
MVEPARIFSHGRLRVEEAVGQLLRDRGWRICVESCTGGLISAG